MNNAEELWEQVEHMIERADQSGKRPAADAIALQQLRAQIVSARALELICDELQIIARILNEK